MKKDFEVSENLLKIILIGNKKKFLKELNGIKSHNVLFAIANDVPPSTLLDRIHENEWNGKVELRGRHDNYYLSQINNAIKNSDHTILGLRKIYNQTPNLAMYYIEKQREKMYAVIDFDGKLSCARIFNYGEELPYLVGILNAYELNVVRNDVLKIKYNLSLFYSSNVYKREIVQKVGEII